MNLLNTMNRKLMQGIIETKFGYIINGHYYDKGLNYYEKHEASCGLYNDNQLRPSLDIAHATSLYNDNFYHYNLFDNNIGIIEDEYIPNRYYIINDKTVNNNTNSISIIEEKDGEIKTIYRRNYINDARHYISEYIGQTKDKIFFASHWIMCIDKKTFKITYTYEYGNEFIHLKKIYEKENFIYIFVVRRYGYNDFELLRLNTTTLEIVQKKINSNTFYKPYRFQNDNISNMSKDYAKKYGDIFYPDNFYFKDNICHIYAPLNLMPNKYDIPEGWTEIPEFYTQMCHIVIDFNNDDWNKINFNVIDDIDIIGIKELMQPVINSNVVIQKTWIIEDKYLCMFSYNDYTGNSFTPYQNLHMFKIKNDCSLEYLYSEPVTRNKQINTIVFNSDRTYIIVGYTNAFTILKYDFNKHKYIPSNIYMYSITKVGFDELDRLWYVESNGEIHVQNLTDPYDVIIKFEKDNYIYERDKEIETYIDFKALTFEGEYADGKYEFKLSGDAYFKSNSKKILNYNYTEKAKIRIPVNIININGLQCSVTYIGELDKE